MQIKGQDILLKKLSALTIDTWPKALLLLGEKGCGKHLVAKFIADKFNTELIEITDKLSAEDLADLSYNSVTTTYLIDFNKFQEKQQNAFLKFIEEPPVGAHIILLADSERILLPTILNRCSKYFFQAYTEEVLREFTVKDADSIVFKICRTPGQLLNISPTQVKRLYDMCLAIISRLPTLDYASVILCSAYINYKEDYDKYDFEHFFTAMALAANKYVIAEKTDTAVNIYKYILSRKSELYGKSLAKEAFVISFLDGLWRLAH